MSILKEFQEEIDRLSVVIKEVPFENKDFYCQWMNQHYHLIQHTTRYLALCASKVDVENEKEFNWWTEHLKEEEGHDIIFIEDMQSLGHVSMAPPLPEVKALLASQYYEIQQNGPDAHLSYALLLEGLSCEVCEPMAIRIENAMDTKATKFLRLHSTIDQDHFPMGIKRIEDEFTEDRKKVVLSTLETTSTLYQHLLQKIAHKVLENSRDGKAA